jgi:hypothetical protein
MQGYDVVLFILELAKTVTPGESPLTVPSGAGRTADYLTVHFSQKILAVQKPIAYTDLLAAGGVFKCDQKRFRCHDW